MAGAFSGDPYETLGVPPTADPAAIRAAYRRCAQASHPDVHPNDASAAARFIACSAAYELLIDAEKRRAYDTGRRTTGSRPAGGARPRAGAAGGRAGTGTGRPGTSGGGSTRAQPADPGPPPTDPIKRRIWELERELEEERFRDEIRESARQRAREEASLPTVTITTEQAAKGAEVLVTAGRRPVRLTVPPGTPAGQIFVLRGLGPEAIGGQPTDLKVRLQHGVPPLSSLWDEIVVSLTKPGRSMRDLAVDALARAMAIYNRFLRE